MPYYGQIFVPKQWIHCQSDEFNGQWDKFVCQSDALLHPVSETVYTVTHINMASRNLITFVIYSGQPRSAVNSFLFVPAMGIHIFRF